MNLICSKLCVTYGSIQALKGLNLSIKSGEIRTLIGPNGSGKSTALQALAGLIKPSSGEVTLEKKPISSLPRRQLAKKLAFLPQQPIAPDEMTVMQLVRQGRFAHVGLLKNYKPHDEEMIQWALMSTGLTHFAERYLRELSGGERQRAWIAAALAQEAKILLLDEPTSFLDIGYQVEVLDLIHHLSRERGTTIIMAIHDLNQAMRVCDHICLLNKGELVFDGCPHDLPTTGLIEKTFNIRGHFVPISPNAPPHFNVNLSRHQTASPT